MSWKRGFFRLWVTVSILWGVLIVSFVIESTSAFTFSKLGSLMIVLAAPPLLLLLIWFIGSWVLRGFKSRN